MSTLATSPPPSASLQLDHLRALEGISRHLRNQNFCNFLKQSKSNAEVMDLLQEADNNQLD